MKFILFGPGESTQYRGSAFMCGSRPEEDGCDRIQLQGSSPNAGQVVQERPILRFFPTLEGIWYTHLKVVSI